MKETVDHIYEIREIAGVSKPGCAIMIPFPGSRTFKMLMDIPTLRKKYICRDLIDSQELRKDWINHFTSVDYDVLMNISDELFNKNTIGSRMGVLTLP